MYPHHEKIFCLSFMLFVEKLCICSLMANFAVTHFKVVTLYLPIWVHFWLSKLDIPMNVRKDLINAPIFFLQIFRCEFGDWFLPLFQKTQPVALEGAEESKASFWHCQWTPLKIGLALLRWLVQNQLVNWHYCIETAEQTCLMKKKKGLEWN